MLTLVLCDDFWHPAKTAQTGLAPLQSDGFAFDWLENGGEWSAELMAQYPAVILTKSNNISAANEQPWLTAARQAVFSDYVRRGNGLLVIHSGLAGYDDLPLIRELFGGVFASHPPQCPVTIKPQPLHPFAPGSDSFAVTDEHYFIGFFDDRADVFLTTQSQHGTQPGGWTRTEGLGRVCALTPGHTPDVWLHPAYQNIIKTALCWCHKTL